MNSDRVRLVRTFIEQTPDRHFDMNSFLRPLDENRPFTCGTAGCIAGFATMLAVGADVSENEYSIRRKFNAPTIDVAAEFMGLDESTAETLFTPDKVKCSEVTKEQALAILDVLLATGTVTDNDWLEVCAL